MNAIVTKLAGGVLMLCILAGSSIGDETQTTGKRKFSKTKSNMWKIWRLSVSAPEQGEKRTTTETTPVKKVPVKTATDTKKPEPKKMNPGVLENKAVKKPVKKPAEPAEVKKPAEPVKEVVKEVAVTKPAEPEKVVEANKDGFDPLRKLIGVGGSDLVLSAHDVSDPVALADKLYAKNLPEAAAVFYRLAIADEDSDDETTADQAWVNLQLGNCLRHIDPAGAREKYKIVMSQYPDSPWASMAKMQDEFAGWWLRNRPDQLTPPETENTLPTSKKIDSSKGDK